MLKLWRPNKDIISGLNEAAERIEEQEKIIESLRNKLKSRKEVLKDKLMVDYREMEEIKNRYIQYYKSSPFHLTEEELPDYNDFCDNHQSSREEPDEDGDRTCRHADGIQSHIIFYFNPSMYHRNNITVECPYCHTKRKLGTGKDELYEYEEPVKVDE